MPNKVSEAIARPVRTGTQFGLGFAVVAVIAAFVRLTPEQYTALVGLATIVLGYVQVQLENRLGKAVLRQVPPKTAPVVDDKGHLGANVGVWILAVVGIVLLLLLLVGVIHAR